MIPARVTLRITSLRIERIRPQCQQVIFDFIYARNVLPPLTHTETLYLSVWRRALSCLPRSARVRESRARRLNSFLFSLFIARRLDSFRGCQFSQRRSEWE